MAFQNFRPQPWSSPQAILRFARLRAPILRRRFLQEDAKQQQIAKPSTGPEAQDSHSSIPGPGWVWQPLAAPFRAYDRAAVSRPYLTQFASALVIWFCGDLASQYIRQRGENPDSPGRGLVENYSYERSIRSMFIGGISAIPSWRWFMFLSKNFNAPASFPARWFWSLLYKIGVNQFFYAPAFNFYFFGMQSLFSGDGGPTDLPQDATLLQRLAPGDRLAVAWDRIYHTIPVSWYNSFKYWPFVMGFTMTFVPMRHRSIFAGGAAIVWQSYLGVLNQRDADRAKAQGVVEA